MQTSVENDRVKTKVMVIGLDGATFDVLNPMIDHGKLPHLASLIKNGTSGRLRSTIPPLSPAAWSTFQTGKNPGKHGIFDFMRNIPGEYGSSIGNSTFLKSKTLWEILSRNGKSVGVLNVMFNYPPRKVRGFIVSGKETPGEDKDYTFPKSLKSEILEYEPKYQAEPFRRVSQTKGFLKTVPVLLNRQEKVNRYLLDKYSPDFFMNLFAIPDILHHLFWKHMDPSHPHYREKESRIYLPLIEKAYQTLDDIIGRRLEMIDENTVVIIMSDHGAGPLHKHIQLNRWLKKEGFLAVKKEVSASGSLLPKGIKRMLRKIYIQLVMHDRFAVIKRLKLKTAGKREAFAKNMIDWSNTKAYSGRMSEHGIYCNLKGREKEGVVNEGQEYEQLRRLLISRLSELKDPETGLKLFEHVYTREEVYRGPCTVSAPDIILGFGNNPYEPGTALLDGDIVEKVQNYSFNGMHRPDGILIVRGKDVKKGAEIQGANICDLTPTVLYMMGVKIPTDIDGKVLCDLFDPLFINENCVEYEEVDSDSDGQKGANAEVKYNGQEAKEIEERLKSLGYL